MTNYDEPVEGDPVVAEVRRIREEIFAEYNYDLRAMFDAYQQREATSGRVYADRAPQPITPTAAKKVG